MLSYLLAVLAAGCDAASNILQRQANKKEPAEKAMRLQLMLDLVRQPVWLAGLITVISSFVLDAAALSIGRLATVQPILVLELPLTLVGGSLLAARQGGGKRSRLGRQEWAAVVLMTAGVAGLIFCLDPSSPPHAKVAWVSWVIGIGATAAAVSVCVAASRGGGGRRPALLGIGAGVAFGTTAAFMKAATAGLHHGLIGILAEWTTYAMAGTGLMAMFLMQNALQAGRLLAAQPGITLGDPAVSIVWGVLAFGEAVRGGGYLAGAVAAGLVLAAGVVTLSRSPLLGDGGGGDEQDRPGRPAAVSVG